MKSITFLELADIISEAVKQENENYFHYRDLNPDDTDIYSMHITALGAYCQLLHQIKNYMEA